MSFRFFIEYGWGAPKIADQFEKFDGLKTPPDEEIERWQNIADAILMVSLHSMFPDSQVQTARDKLARKIEKWLVENEYIKLAEPTS